MANYLWNIKTIFLILMISLLPQMICAKPIPGRKSDLISGNEFLSIFLDQYDSKKDTNRNRNYYIENESSELDELKLLNKNLKDEEDLLITENSSNYGQRLQNDQSQKFNKKFIRGDKTSSSLSNKHGLESNDETSDDSISKQIVKFVTTGSKIVFLDDLPDSEKESHTTPDHRNFDKSKKPNTTKIPESSKQSDVKVISVSVSSTIARQKATLKPSPMDQQINEVTSFTSPAINDEFTENFYVDDEEQSNTKTIDSENKNDFINHARKSDFSIEETDPVTMSQDTDSILIDSVNGESTNVHSILAPPHNIRLDSSSSSSSISTSIGINQSQRQQSQRQQSQNHPNEKNLKTGGGNINEPENDNADKFSIPFQTVIYHDNGYNKDGNAQPRSVSYSSIAQSIDQLNGWKESESLLEAKKNVSDSLKKPLSFSPSSQPEQVYSEPSKFYSEPARMYGQPSKFYSEPSKVYSEPAKVYGQPERQYGEPSKIYSEPSKIYSEPSKVYSEPSKVYGVPSKVYWPRPTVATTPTPTASTTMQSAVIVGNHGNQKNVPTVPTRHPSLNSRRVIFNLDKLPYDLLNAPEESDKSLLESSKRNGNNNNGNVGIGQRLKPSSMVTVVREQHSQTHHYRHRQYTHHNTGLSQSIDGSTKPMGSDLVTERPNYSSSPSLLSVTTESGIAGENLYTPTPEQNYEIEESVSVMTNGRAHGIQTMVTTTSPAGQSAVPAPVRSNAGNNNGEDDSKVGYVVEGRNFRKYRVEEKTSDGFIVGEYGVVSHNDGGVRGVRYTADSNINPSLIHQALMKFLSL